MEMGSSPIGENSSIVDGKLILLQGDGNADLGPPQLVCLPATVVQLNTVLVMELAQLSISRNYKGDGYSYPLLP